MKFNEALSKMRESGYDNYDIDKKSIHRLYFTLRAVCKLEDFRILIGENEIVILPIDKNEKMLFMRPKQNIMKVIQDFSKIQKPIRFINMADIENKTKELNS